MNRLNTRLRRLILALSFSLFFLFSFSQEEEYTDYSKNNISKVQGSFNILLDFKNINYHEFESLLGNENVDFLNDQNSLATFEIAMAINDFYYGIDFGYENGFSKDNDTLTREANSTNFGIVLGYNRINTGDVIIRPEIGITWYRMRLLNYDRSSKIPINSYMEKRDLDMRFNNILGYLGLNFSYKILDKSKFYFSHVLLGFYFGYNIALNKNTWVYSKRNRLITDKTINFDRYRLGFTFCFLLD